MELRQHSILRISDEKTLELIELYEKEECLWNTFTPDYKSRSKRQLAAERIAKKLDIKHFTSRFVIIKFKNLRNSYCQELKKVATSVKNGDRPTYQPKVFWFNKMDSFVRPHLQRLQHTRARKPRRSAKEPPRQPVVDPARQPIMEPERKAVMEPAIKNEHNVLTEVIVKIEPPDPLGGQASREEEQSSIPEPEMPPNFSDEFFEDRSYEEDSSEPVRKRSRIPSITHTPNRPRNEESHHTRFRIEESPGVDTKELVCLMKDISSYLHVMTTQNNDCFDSFGKYVASMLKNMPHQRAVAVQPRIMDLLIEAAVMDERRQ